LPVYAAHAVLGPDLAFPARDPTCLAMAANQIPHPIQKPSVNISGTQAYLQVAELIGENRSEIDFMTSIQAGRLNRRRMKRPGYAVAAGVMLILAIATATLPGCAVKKIGDFDSTFDNNVSDLEQKTELHFAQLKSNPSKPFDQDFYDDADARIAVLKTRAAALPKYDILSQQLNNLQSQFDDFEKLDKASPRPISGAAVGDGQSLIAVSFESILRLELALQRTGTTSAAAQAPSKTK